MSTVSWARDAIERIVWTGVQVIVAAALLAVVGVVTSAEDVSLDVAKAALLAGVAAAVAALKAYVAKFVDGTISPASTAKVS